MIVQERMSLDGSDQQGELAVIQMDMASVDPARKACSPRPVLRIQAVALTTRVMQEGKVFNYPGIRAVSMGEVQAVEPDPCPVRSPMQSQPFESERLPQASDKFGRNETRSSANREGIGQLHRIDRDGSLETIDQACGDE